MIRWTVALTLVCIVAAGNGCSLVEDFLRRVGDNGTTRPDPTPAPTSTPTEAPTATPQPTVAPSPSPSPRPTSPPRPMPTGDFQCGGGFLWKPGGEHTGKLVVLLPSRFTGLVASVAVHKGKNGPLVERGRPSGVANGNREHFRFNQPGNAYTTLTNSQIVVQINGKTGGTAYYTIPNGSVRCE